MQWVDMLERIIGDAEESGSLSDLQLATACVLGFSGFLRFDELIKLRACGMVFFWRNADNQDTWEQNRSITPGRWSGDS